MQAEPPTAVGKNEGVTFLGSGYAGDPTGPDSQEVGVGGRRLRTDYEWKIDLIRRPYASPVRVHRSDRYWTLKLRENGQVLAPHRGIA